MSFRRKVIFSQLILFIFFVAILFPLVEKMVKGLMRESLEESTEELIKHIDDARSEQEMIELLKTQEYYVFFRITLLNDKKELIYDSHLEQILKNNRSFATTGDEPEVQEAFKNGNGFSISYSKLFMGKFAYVAKRFSFQKNTYVLRTSFPFGQVQDLTQNFEIGFIIFSFMMLLFFNAITWGVFNRLSKPIRQIIAAITPYQTGQKDELPEISLEKSLNENDDFTRLALTLNSLSSRIRAQINNLTKERNEKEAVLESLGEGVIAVDQETRITYANHIASKLLNISRRQLRGKLLSQILESNGSSLLNRCYALLQACQDQGVILTDSLSIGEEKKIYIDLVAAPKSKGNGAIIVMQDKSSHYKVLEMGKDFVANASHELRTPITIVKGFAETLHDLPEMSHEMMMDITEKIVRNCERMENLVKNLLTLADLENIPESRFRECDLVSMIENCKHMIQMLHPEAQVKIAKKEEEILILADKDVLELAFMNLLGNAVKYSRAPAKITIGLRSTSQEEVEVTISDQGIGIPPQDLEHIFERFYTVDKAHSRKLGGAGLGLSIVKTIIDKHDGLIKADSVVGQGTTFTIVLSKSRSKADSTS